MMSTPILTTSHYGVVRFGDLAVEAVVLEDGTRGYVQRQLATAIGLHESRRGSQPLQMTLFIGALEGGQ